MTLTTRLTAAMVALVLLTAAAVGYLSYRNVEAGMLPTELERVETRARQLAGELEAYVRSARADVIAFRSAVALEGMMRATRADGIDPDSGLSLSQWTERFAARFTAELAAKPAYAQFRVVGIADGGREILRVDRSGPNDAIRVVPAGELQQQGDRDYFRQTARLSLGEVYVSPIELNREHGAIEAPYRPVMRVAAPVHAPDGRIFGIIAINVDLQPAFDLVRSATRPGRRTFVVNDRGDYLVHPDPAREFGFEFGRPARWQDEFPEFATALGPAQRGVHIVNDLAGERNGIALASARLAEGPRVAVIGTMPYAELVAPAAAVGRSTFIVGIVAVIAAIWLAVPLARTLTRPVVQMTAAVEAFGRGEPMAVPTEAKGEVGVLARAFARMADEVRDTHAELTMEIAERRRLFDTSLDLIVVGDARGNFLRLSPSSLAIVGYRPEELIGRSGIDVVYPGDLEKVRQEMRLTRRGREMRNFECRYIHKDGRIVTLAWTGVWSEPEQVYFFIGRDMTERKQAEEALRDSELVARGIVETALDVFVQMDEAGRITEWNSQAQKLFGWSREEAVGQPLGTLIVPPQYRERHAAGLERFLRTHEGTILGQRFEIEALRRDGSEFKVEVAVTALRRGGGYVFNAFIRDLTEKIAAEAQLRQSQKMDAIGQLTGGVAHDFNNILTVITGTIEILEEGVAARPHLAALAHMIDEAATRGADLTRQLLAFARKQPLEPRDTDVNTLIVDTAKLLRPTLGEQIEIESMLGDDTWHTLIDPSQLSSAIVNLAVNARDAMPDGGKLTLETDNIVLDEAYARSNPEVKPGAYVLVAVSDTGTGMSQAIRDKVFEPFFTTKDMGKGTGLGLSMVYGFVRQSGGHIKVYSEEGHGTTIKIYLPRLVDEGPKVAEPATTPVVGGHETILVVEDDDLVRNYVIAQLNSLGYATLAAASAAEALALVEGGAKFDLLFTDVIMPGMNGRQLADELAKRWPSLPVLYTSGYTENAIVHHGRLDPGVALLNKPYRKTDLAQKVREALAIAPRAA